MISSTYDWWKRLISFFILLIFSFWALSVLYYGVLYPSPLLNEFRILLSVLIPSYLVEHFRPNSNFLYLGFFFDDITKRNLNFVLFLSLIAFLICALFYILIGAKVELSNTLELSGILLLALGFLIKAFTEELVFRGIIFQTLMERYGEIFAALFISIVFGIAHSFNPGANFFSVINIILSGLVISYIFIQTRSLIIVTVYHFLWNSFQFFILGWNVSGLSFYYNITFFEKTNLPELLTGGTFGLEASPALTVLLLLQAYFFVKYLKKSPFISSLLLKRDYIKPEYI